MRMDKNIAYCGVDCSACNDCPSCRQTDWADEYCMPANCCIEFEDRARSESFLKAYPRFMTDSTVLGEYLSQQRFRSEVRGTDMGVDILIYDVLEK